MKSEKSPGRIECPICGHGMEFKISRDAVLSDLDRMNDVIYKSKVREAFRKYTVVGKNIETGTIEAHIRDYNKFIKELNLEDEWNNPRVGYTQLEKEPMG